MTRWMRFDLRADWWDRRRRHDVASGALRISRARACAAASLTLEANLMAVAPYRASSTEG
jgi:hypothetical protein